MQITPKQEAYMRVWSIVRQQGQVGGLKMYMWAKRADDYTLLVSTAKFPDQRQNW